jgi:lipopolysaccharide export system protein LptA
MAASYHNPPRALCALLLLLGWLGAAAAATTYDSTAPINLEAASSDFDYRNNTLLFKRVKITQGMLTVEAQEASATGLEFDNSQWTLKGEVRITVPDGKLTSDSATVSFKDNQIARAQVRGGPATFEQRIEKTGQLARGRAGSIDYDVRNGTVELAGQAWLSDGQNEISGSKLIYDIGRQRVAANPGETEPGGVRITINPKEPVGQKKPQPPADAPPP